MAEKNSMKPSAHRASVGGCAPLGLLLGLTLALAGCADPTGFSDTESLDSTEGGDGGLDDKAAAPSRYEAENRTAQSGCDIASNYAGYTGAGFVDFGDNGTWIEWNNIDATLAGQYTVTLRYANGRSPDRPATVSVNGTTVSTVPFAQTGDEWTSWRTTSLVVSLRQGKNTIRVRASTSSGGPNVDHAEVTAKDLCVSDPNKTEPGECGCGKAEGTCSSSTSASRYEAESRTAQSGCTAESNYAGFTGTGFMNFGGDGTWIEWNNINAALAGQYTVTLRYANGGGAERPATLAVNGTTAGTLQFDSTDEWTSWRTASLVVSLRQGNNTVRVTANTSAGGPNVDHAELALRAASDLCPSDPTKTAPGLCGCGVPEGSCGGTSPTAVKLPIEVLGPAGTTETVQVQVDDPTNVTHLYLRCNSCGYHVSDHDRNASMVKATVSINGGTAIALKRYTGGDVDVGNRTVEIIGAEADYGGIGGVFRTVRMKVPVSGLRKGTNSITFVHKTPAAPSIGFRIIELNLMRGGTTPILTSASFTQDDPSTWKAPLTAASDIEAGRVLWNTRSRLNDPGVDAINGSASGRIAASCADCHASDGRDLAYFNFSNRSIIERSIFHSLSRTEGERIASYVRSRPLAKVAAARPWNPAYQPGPGLDAKPAYEWAAGAGVNAILDTDAAMKPYLFPAGTGSAAEVAKVVNRLGKLNMRELRISLPLPEWNQWLPLIHPDDAFNTSASAITSNEDGDNVGKPYYTALYQEAAASPTPRSIGDMTTRVKAWLRRGMTCDTNGSGNGEPWRGLNGGVLNAIKLPKKAYSTCVPKDDRSRADEEAYEVSKRGLAAWIAVKQWEIVHSKNLEDEGKKTQTASVPYTGGSRTLRSDSVCSSACVDARERGWFVAGRNVFDRPPHFTGHNSRNFYGQDTVTGVAETNAWYHLNMILDPGYRIMMPNHFAYICSHVEILQAESGVDQGFRFWASMIKQRQLQTNGLYGAETGNDLRTSQPHVYYKANRSSGTSQTQASVGQPLWGYLAQAMVQDFVADSNRAIRAEWESAVNNSAVQDWDSRDFSTGNTFDTDKYQGRNTYRVIPRLREIGVSSSVVNSLIDWGKKTWPYGNWDALR